MNDENQRKIGALLSYVVIMLNLVITLFYTPILTRSLGQSEYGLYSMVSSIISTLTILDFGFASALVVYSNRYRVKKEFEKEHNLYGMFIIVYTIIGLLVALFGFTIYLNVENLFGATMNAYELVTAKKLMLILTFNLAVTFPLSVFSSIVTAYEKFIFAKLVNIVTIILQPVTMLILLSFGFKSVALAIVITVLNILSLLFSALYCKYKIKTKIKFGKIDFKLLFAIFSFSFWIFINTVVDKVNWSIDNFLIGSLSGAAAVSIYAIASHINQVYISFSTAISGVLLPKMTKMVENKATDQEFTDVLIRTGRIQLMVVGLILTGFIVFGKNFIILWVGQEYQDAYYIGLALMIPMIDSLIKNSVISITQAKNKHQFLPKVLIITSILNIIVSIPLIKMYGGLGAAIGTAISLFIGNIVIKNIYYHKSLHLDMIRFTKETLNIFIALITETLLFFGVINLFHIQITSWFILFIWLLIYTITYLSISRFYLTDYEKEMIREFKNKLIGRKI